VLREIEGLSTDETARLLAIRPETVKTRLHRARRLLRVAVERRLSAAFGDIFPFGGARCARTAERVVERLRASSA
jgi:RNA polymerase sigma-70 factor (ECF subfamily)